MSSVVRIVRGSRGRGHMVGDTDTISRQLGRHGVRAVSLVSSRVSQTCTIVSQALKHYNQMLLT